MKFELSFSNKVVTPWGRDGFLIQILTKINFREQITGCAALPVQNLNRGYDVPPVESFIASVWVWS